MLCLGRKGCLEDEFRCRRSRKCIPAYKRCNQKRDCKDGSDEKNCNYQILIIGSHIFYIKLYLIETNRTGQKECLEDEFRCKRGRKCIPAFKRCNRKRDCKDGSDEENCNEQIFLASVIIFFKSL